MPDPQAWPEDEHLLRAPGADASWSESRYAAGIVEHGDLLEADTAITVHSHLGGRDA